MNLEDTSVQLLIQFVEEIDVTGVRIEVWTQKVEQPIIINERTKEMFSMAKNQKIYSPEFKQQIVDL